MEMKVRLVLRLINTPMKIWTKYRTMRCQSTLCKMNPNKIEKAGDNATVAAPLAERMRLLKLNTLQLRMDRKTREKTWMKQSIMLLTVL
jgi:hypothetical protein